MDSWPETAKDGLNDLTMLLYAHPYENGEGVEQQCGGFKSRGKQKESLDHNADQLTFNAYEIDETEEKIRKSLLIKVPPFVQRKLAYKANDNESERIGFSIRLQQLTLDLFLCAP